MLLPIGLRSSPRSLAYSGSYKVVKTIGCATTRHEIERLEQLAREEIERLSGNQLKLFGYESDEIIEQAFSVPGNSSGYSLSFLRQIERQTQATD